jgi:SNF family Na+-dependent transporter
MCRNSTADELGSSGSMYKAWRIVARFIAPIGILIVLINNLRPGIEKLLGS